jgi:phosphatidylglycerophosphate synthase
MNEPQRFVILADESASWRIGGLRQIDRLLLAIDEWAQNAGLSHVDVRLWWRSEAEAIAVSVPPRATHIKLTSEDAQAGTNDLLLSTHIVFRRGGIAGAIAQRDFIARPLHAWDAATNAIMSTAPVTEHHFLVTAEEQISGAERWLLTGTLKPEDGLASRFINRPISRRISRLLLRTKITPNGWNLLILLLPVVASSLLFRGDYWSIVWSFVLLNGYSVLDGCDGEIARTRFLESKRGAELDNWCDILSSVLMLVGLGAGLARQHPGATLEAVTGAMLIVANEMWLARTEAPAATAIGPGRGDAAIYARHRELLRRSGILSPNGAMTSAIIQLTKRDLATWFFLLLAIGGRPQWILHLSLIAALATSAFAVVSLVRQRRPARQT